jgi:hypothetical protein
VALATCLAIGAVGLVGTLRSAPHLATADDVERMIRAHRTRTIVATPWNNILPPVPRYESLARQGGFRLIAQSGGVRVYSLPDAP